MDKVQIKQLVDTLIPEPGLVDTGIGGMRLFRVTNSVQCAPAIYEPSIIAILSGEKEAVLDGVKFEYDSNNYMCCSMSMPVEAGTPKASPKNPLLGVLISLDTQVMTELAIKMTCASNSPRESLKATPPRGLTLARWDEAFGDALLRLLQLCETPADAKVLGEGRIRELYYAVLNGDAGEAARRTFGAGNEIARAIEYLSNRLCDQITIEETADYIGMSRAVFHRKFKSATTMSPIQFVKSMRLNRAAMKIAGGTHVNVAAAEVGYLSSSQFSREFKRMYGLSPRQWGQSQSMVSKIV